MRADSVAVGSFPIDSFPCSGARPEEQESSPGSSLEGYIGMQVMAIHSQGLFVLMLVWLCIDQPRWSTCPARR